MRAGRVAVELGELIALRQRVAQIPRRTRIHAVAPGGAHVSRRRGRGMDYLESRAYQAGDDVRRLDWRLTARRGQLHTKVFQEEAEQRVMVLIDTHASMRFGTRERFKSVQAARAAALIAWHVARAGGAVGALAFGACREVQRAAAARHGALGVCGALARWDHMVQDADAASAEPLSIALRRMRPRLAGASQVLLVTDGHSCDEAAISLLARWARRGRLSVLGVTDPLESEAPPRGRYPFDWAGHRRTLDLESARAREAFAQTMGAPANRLEEACRAAALPWQRIDTRADPLAAVRALLGGGRRP
jgi:uncharacterized protein (DUF58 family)